MILDTPGSGGHVIKDIKWGVKRGSEGVIVSRARAFIDPESRGRGGIDVSVEICNLFRFILANLGPWTNQIDQTEAGA